MDAKTKEYFKKVNNYFNRLSDKEFNYLVDMLSIKRDEKVKFCDNCRHLYPKEHEQTKQKESHICAKYMQTVYHRNFHPNLVRLSVCEES